LICVKAHDAIPAPEDRCPARQAPKTRAACTYGMVIKLAHHHDPCAHLLFLIAIKTA
jgi:hypothetical protein